MDRTRHLPVMASEALDALAVRTGGIYVDATLGGGGHAARIADAVGPLGWLIGLDRDPEAIRRAAWLEERGPGRVTLRQADFRTLRKVLDDLGVPAVDGVLFDLGVSSDQLDRPERGFSFQHDGPLDMRMDPTQGETAADLLNRLDADELAAILRNYGEERQARRVAAALVAIRRDRPWSRTRQLAEWAARCLPKRGGIHPATRLFQALRIAVNDELGALEEGLEAAIARVRTGGRIVVIAFHSLEDRIVKQVFHRHCARWENLQAGGRRRTGEPPFVTPIFRKPRLPSREEIEQNPRARSARLRAVERVGEDVLCAA